MRAEERSHPPSTIQPPGPGLAPGSIRSPASLSGELKMRNCTVFSGRSPTYVVVHAATPVVRCNPTPPQAKPHTHTLRLSASIMPGQHSSQFPIENHLPEYIPLPLSDPPRSFEAAPAQEAREAQYATPIAGYPHYAGHQYPSSFNQPPHAYAHHAPPASLTTSHSPGHHHHSSSASSSLSTEIFYSSSALDSAYASGTLAPVSTHHPSPSLPQNFHPHLTLAGAGYHRLHPSHKNPHIDPEHYQSSFSRSADQLPPTSIPVSPTYSNPASISPSASPVEYISGIPVEYPVPLMSSAHDDSLRQPLLPSSHNSFSPSTPTAPYPNSTTHHRTHHSLPSFADGPTDSNATSSVLTAHHYNYQTPITSMSGTPTSGSNIRSRHAHHGSASNLYSPYSPPRALATSSLNLDAPRPHVCEICQVAFQRNHDLKRHKDVHKDTKPYVCQCGRAFTRKDALKRHMFLKNCGKDKGHESA